MTVHEVLYRLTWQVAGYPENSVIGKHSSISLVRDLLMARGIDKIELRVMEATSARLPAPGAESTERVDRTGRSRPGGRHAAPRTAEPDPRDVSSGNGTEFS